MKPANENKDIAKQHGGFYDNLFSNLLHQVHPISDGSEALTLNVLLLGDRQSGRSSVGNALIGGEEFGAQRWAADISVTTDRRSRTFRGFFRRQGAETDLRLVVTDSPPLPRPSQAGHTVCTWGPESVHVLVLVGEGLTPTSYLTRAPHWLSTLADKVAGGAMLMDNSSDWPVRRGAPLRDRVLNLSARNQHAVLRTIRLTPDALPTN
ncbi:hypothetical protein NHX12_013988 [Muraenolepis orangiensis]|uniref:AIG1-type G domain-containing protein n=1 Tax=Muraenolepis orangiensis TaxID=630683 RepID=A0A9Q0I3B5_9TELE|nr:hypothetical protein NHX12_013988 [Muraenolepis orangiensis]